MLAGRIHSLGVVSAMELLDESSVSEREIDTLGHVNVRFYLGRVERAAVKLMSALGVVEAIEDSADMLLRRLDTYCRFRREQFAEARLLVNGGVLNAAADRLRMFFEIRNADDGELAATFIIENGLVENSTRQAIEFPERLVRLGEGQRIDLPEYGKSRSIDLEAPLRSVDLAALEARVSGAEHSGLAGGHSEWTVDPARCDEHGYLAERDDLSFGVHRGLRKRGGKRVGPPTFVTDDGHRFGWALMETRARLLATPRANDRIRSVSGDVAIGERWRHSRRWVFNVGTGELVAVDDRVGLAMDLDARRSIEIPQGFRKEIARAYVPEFA